MEVPKGPSRGIRTEIEVFMYKQLTLSLIFISSLSIAQIPVKKTELLQQAKQQALEKHLAEKEQAKKDLLIASAITAMLEASSLLKLPKDSASDKILVLLQGVGLGFAIVKWFDVAVYFCPPIRSQSEETTKEETQNA